MFRSIHGGNTASHQGSRVHFFHILGHYTNFLHSSNRPSHQLPSFPPRRRPQDRITAITVPVQHQEVHTPYGPSVMGIGRCFAYLMAVAPLIRRQLPSIWSIEQGMLLRGTFGQVSTHRKQALSKAMVRRPHIKNGSVVWTDKCLLRTGRLGRRCLVSYLACVRGLRDPAEMVMLLSVEALCGRDTCRRTSWSWSHGLAERRIAGTPNGR